MKNLFLFALAAMMIGGCSESQTDDNGYDSVDEIRLSTNDLVFDATGGKKYIHIDLYYDSSWASGAEWKLTGGESWCHSSHPYGINGLEINFQVEENNDSKDRKATFVFTSGTASATLTVTQQKVKLTTTSDTIEVNAAGGETIIEVKDSFFDNKFDYEIGDNCKNWITWERKSYPSQFIFNIAPNTKTEKREGTITITNGELSETITISQKGLNYSTVHVAQKGTLASVLTENGLDANSVVSLKISGVLNDEDFVTISQMSALRNLDIYEVEITELLKNAFYESRNVQHLILPKTLATIGEEMFYQSTLQSIIIPNGVMTIGRSAFQFSGLKTITFEKGSQLKAIDYETFDECPLTSIEIPASVETIGWSAFWKCSKLATVTFEKDSQLKAIQSSAFFRCTSLTSIEIPASVETIEESAFFECTSLASITFEEGSQLKTIGGDSSLSFYGAFKGCTSLTSVEIPASVETIEAAAFKGCSKLATVTFEKGSQLKTIGGGYYKSRYDGKEYYYGAFSELTNLTTVDMSECTQVQSIGECAFYGDSELRLFKIGTATPPKCDGSAFGGINPASVLKVPSGCADAYKATYCWYVFASITGLDE